MKIDYHFMTCSNYDKTVNVFDMVLFFLLCIVCSPRVMSASYLVPELWQVLWIWNLSRNPAIAEKNPVLFLNNTWRIRSADITNNQAQGIKVTLLQTLLFPTNFWWLGNTYSFILLLVSKLKCIFQFLSLLDH